MSLEMYTQLDSVSTELVSSLQQLHDTLENEFHCLKNKNIETLTDIVQEKKRLSERIELFEQQFVSLIAQNSTDDEQQNITEFIAVAADSIPTLATNWHKIEQLGKACADQNQINGIILQNNKRNVESRLAILHGQSLTPSAYARDGRTTNFTHSKTLAQV